MTFKTKLAIAFTLLLLCIASIGGQTIFSSTPIPVTGNSVVATVSDPVAVPTLNDFIQQVQNGDPSALVGVYVAGQMALPVLQQPTDNASFVSTTPEVVTQFRAASQFNSAGLLAHNFLAGQHFFQLQKGQEVNLVYGNGTTKQYKIDNILSYQALSPEDIYSNFIALQGDHNQMTSTDLFYQTYGQGDNLVLQTCIQVGNEPSWGRLFVIAHPEVNPVTTAPSQNLPMSSLVNARPY